MKKKTRALLGEKRGGKQTPWEKKETALERLLLDKNERIVDRTISVRSRKILADGLVTDGGVHMVRGSNFKSFCMVALLVAEATQAVTPDITSLASTRLFQIVGAIAEHGESRVTHALHVGCLTIHTEKSPPPNGTVPFEDRSEDSAPDEVYLALAPQLPVNEAGNSHKSRHVPFDLDMLTVHSGRLGSTCVSDPVPCSSALIHSLCRMTC